MIRRPFVCSLTFNTTAEEQLARLERSADRDFVEGRLKDYAFEASVEIAGALDNPTCHMKGMPQDLKDIRKVKVGRHRVYFTGHHSKCTYDIRFIKVHKKDDKLEENRRSFQETLKRMIDAPVVRELKQPKEIPDNCE